MRTSSPAPVPGSGFGARVDEAVEAHLADLSKIEAVASAQAAGLLAGAVMTVRDVLKDPQLANPGTGGTTSPIGTERRCHTPDSPSG